MVIFWPRTVRVCTSASGTSVAKPAVRTMSTASPSALKTASRVAGVAMSRPAGVTTGRAGSKGTRHTFGMSFVLRQNSRKSGAPFEALLLVRSHDASTRQPIF